MCLPLRLTFLLALSACSIAPTNPYDPATPASKQAPGTVSGKVSLQTSAGNATPLAGASLTLSGSGASAGLTTTSDANGLFSFTSVSVGTYTVTATHAYAYPTSVGVTLVAGAAQSVALLLPYQSSTTETQTTLTLGNPALSASVNGQGFTNNAQLLTHLFATGAATMQLACGTSLAQQTPQPFAPVALCTLPSTASAYTVAVNFSDAAGNTSPAAEVNVYYDPTPPTPPVVAGVGVTTANTTASVSLTTAATDAAIASDPDGTRFVYQLRGAQYTDWTDCGTALPALGWAQDSTCGGAPFTFKLQANATNSLRVRARDRASNVSSDSGLTIVQDNTAPGLVIHQNSDGSTGAWGSADVVSGNGAVTVSWDPPGDTDVAGYLVYYGPAASGSTMPSAYNGTTASQGPSPIDVGKPCAASSTGDNCVMRITGLADGTQLTVSVAAYDSTQTPTPNVGALVPGVQVTPSFMTLKYVGVLTPTQLGAANANTRSVAVRNGMAYLTSGDNGNFTVVDVSQPVYPQILSGVSGLTSGYDVKLQGAYAYVADGLGGLRVVDVSAPLNANIVSTLAVGGVSATALAIVGDHIYVAANTGIYALSTNSTDCSGGTPYSPCLMGTFTASPNNFIDIAAQGNTLYVASVGSDLVYVIDATTPAAMAQLGTCNTGAIVEGVTVSGQWVYASSGTSIALCDVSNPAAPALVSQSPTVAAGRRVGVGGGFAYTTHAQGFGVTMLNVGASGTPFLQNVTNFPMSGYNSDGGVTSIPQSGSIVADGTYVYVAAGSQGFQIYSTAVPNRLQTTAKLPTTNGGTGASVSLGNLVVAASTRRWTAVNWSPTDANAYATTVTLGQSTYQLDTANGGIVVGSDNVSGGVYAQSIAANGNWVILGSYTSGTGRTFGTSVRWPYAFVAEDAGNVSAPNEIANMLQVIDLRSFAQVGNIAFTPGTTIAPITGRVATYGDFAYVTNGSTGGSNNLIVVNATTPSAMVAKPSVASNYVLGDIKASGTNLYVSHATGFRIFSIGGGTSGQPTDVGGANNLPAGFNPDTIAVSGNYVLLSGANGSALYNAFDPLNPQLLTLHGTGIAPTGAVFGGTSAVVNNAGGPIQFLKFD